MEIRPRHLWLQPNFEMPRLIFFLRVMKVYRHVAEPWLYYLTPCKLSRLLVSSVTFTANELFFFSFARFREVALTPEIKRWKWIIQREWALSARFLIQQCQDFMNLLIMKAIIITMLISLPVPLHTKLDYLQGSQTALEYSVSLPWWKSLISVLRWNFFFCTLFFFKPHSPSA